MYVLLCSEILQTSIADNRRWATAYHGVLKSVVNVVRLLFVTQKIGVWRCHARCQWAVSRDLASAFERGVVWAQPPAASVRKTYESHKGCSWSARVHVSECLRSAAYAHDSNSRPASYADRVRTRELKSVHCQAAYYRHYAIVCRVIFTISGWYLALRLCIAFCVAGCGQVFGAVSYL